MKGWILTGALVIFLLAIGILVGFMTYNQPLTGEKTNCYDRSGNKIIGEKCLVERGPNSKEEALIMAIIIGVLVFVFGMVLVRATHRIVNMGDSSYY